MLHRATLLFLVAAFRFSLEFNYVHLISPLYAYQGFTNVSPSVGTSLLFGMIAALPTMWLPLKISRASDFVILLLYLLVFIPTTVVPLRAEVVSSEALLHFLIAMLAAQFAVWAVLRNVRLDLGSRAEGKAPILAFAAIGGLLLLVVIAVFGIPTRLPTLFEVYDVRTEYKQAASSSFGRIASYAVSWLSSVIAPAAIVFGLVKRRWTLVGAGFVISLYVYGATGFKSAAAYPIGALIAGLFLARVRTIDAALMVGGLVAGVVSVTLVDSGMQAPVLSALLIRRVLFFPGLLSGIYVDFFTSNPPYLLSESVASALQPPVYPISAPYLIGDAFFGNPTMSANSHFWADAFANIRTLGVFVYSCGLAVYLVVLDAVTDAVPAGTVAGLCLPLVIGLSNSAFPTVMLTHGALLLLFVLFLLPLGSVAITGRDGATNPNSP
ncbi:MAG: hypothetical protein P3A58_08075 [Gemmatimonadota bacterium]|nr:hypothetical protein [Gemmatimonadota bacterium]